ncbi:MAG: NAD(P)/FAD-dependent oxidoreductase [Candidatus Krumholzibacteriia bacterium]
MKATYLLIGGGLASMQAARLIRMKDPGGGITLVGREPHLPYDRPPLSKEFLRGDKKASELFYEPPAFFSKNHIETVLGDPVAELDLDTRTSRLAGGGTVTFEKALLATGGEPIPLDVPGADLDGVRYLRSLDDAAHISRLATEAKSALVVGGGFIGMETAASLAALGREVTVIEAMPHVWPRFLDESMAGFVQGYCEERGVRFVTGETVTALRGRSRVEGAVTSSGREVPCDYVCVGVGIRPETGLAEAAGIRVEGGIVVDDHMQTSHPGVYAAGDAVSFPDPVSGKRRRVEHWGHAEYGGQVAGLNMAGGDRRYDLLSYVWSDVFDLRIDCAGDEGERDRVVVRGTPGEPPFTVLYLKDDRLTAYFAVNANSREFPRLQRLIRTRTDLTGKDAELGNPDFDLRTLA